MPSQAVIADPVHHPADGWNDPVRGTVGWTTLFSSDVTPTDSLCAGVAILQPGEGALHAHRHAQAEIYHILEGAGLLTLDGRQTTVSAGQSVFIPGDAAHGLRNVSDAVLRLFYVFPTGTFGDVVYRFEDEA